MSASGGLPFDFTDDDVSVLPIRPVVSRRGSLCRISFSLNFDFAFGFVLIRDIGHLNLEKFIIEMPRSHNQVRIISTWRHPYAADPACAQGFG